MDNSVDSDEEPPDDEPDPPSGNGGTRPGNTRPAVKGSKVRGQPSNGRQGERQTAASAKGSNPKTKEPPRSDSGMSQEAREELHDRRLAVAERQLEDDPKISVGVLTKRIAMATNHRISESTVHALMTEIQGRRPKSNTADAAKQAAEAHQ